MVGRGAIKSPDTQRAHVIPNSHFGPGTDYRGFQGNLIGTYGKSCQKGAHNSYLRQHASLLGIQWVEWFYFLKPDKLMSKLGQFPALLDDK